MAGKRQSSTTSPELLQIRKHIQVAIMLPIFRIIKGKKLKVQPALNINEKPGEISKDFLAKAGIFTKYLNLTHAYRLFRTQ